MRILIVEDERVAARRLERMTREILGDSVTDVTVAERLADGEALMSRNDIDLLLLDLNLNGSDGFELLKSVSAGPFQTIVVSANTDQALRAFEHGVLDFVPKPFDRERLSRALARVSGENTGAGSKTKYLTVKRLGALYLIPIDDVSFLKGAGDYVEIHLKDQKTELHSKSLEAMERILPERFVRVHKSYMVDMEEVKQILVHGGGKYEIELAHGNRVPLSRTRYKDISAALEKR
ncbi:MAG: response regulator [Chitinivibrionales bacterium]|nr:response regulator [Chitinivibrionales bacterium]